MEKRDYFILPEFCNISSPSNESDTNDTSAKGATIIFPVLMFLAGTLGNILALVVLQRTKTHSVFNTLVAGLACTDLTGILLSSPVPISSYINGRQWVGGEMMCKFNGFIMICFGLSTPLIVCIMSIERFLAVRFPFVHSSHCNRSSARVLLVIIWIVVMIFGILPLFGFGKYVIQYPCTWCFLDFHSSDKVLNAYGYLYSSVNLFVFLIMTTCNVYVMFTLLKVRYLKRVAEAQNGNLEVVTLNGGRPIRSHKKKHRSVEMRMIILMCAITLVFAICWVPLMIQMLITMTTGKSNLLLDLTAIRLASVNQTLDPWLYILLRKVFIKKIVGYFKRICGCCRSKSHDTDTVCEKNAHANHLRCFRKQHVPMAHYQCFIQKHAEGARCVVYFQPDSKSSENGCKKLSLPDVMQDIHSRTPFERTPIDDPRPDIAALFDENQLKPPSRHLRLSKTSSNKSNKSIKSNKSDSAFINKGMVNKSDISSADDSETSSSSGHEQCKICSGIEDSNSLDMLSEIVQETEESDVFVTKTTELTSNDGKTLLQIDSNSPRRTKLYSDVVMPCTNLRFSGKKKRAKSYT